ncbi:alpha/beta fold hydrolase [Aeromicrobium sp. Root495]|uniref:alpha/beta fold hydrolase n=1 Tax=Aeromicrobium sp. Root495 TaxID=1736550 RepID=UPI0019103E38|nr:alpha/beta hydrolase [Aeromicrobium sp. Root495]
MVHVDVDGTRLHVQDLGEGPVAVLVSGFGLDHQLWDRQVRVLVEAGLRVVCVDQRGHGLSDRPLSGYAVEDLAEDLRRVLEALDLRDVTLVGHSFGGQVAFRLAATDPDRVARLVLVGSNGLRASRSEAFPFGRSPEATIDALVQAESEQRVASRVQTIASGFAAQPDPAVLEWLVAVSLQMPSWAAVACYRSMLETDLMDDLLRVGQPVLQVIGSADPVHSAKGARWLSERLVDSTLVEIEGCGHYPMLEAADAFEAALVPFARGV